LSDAPEKIMVCRKIAFTPSAIRRSRLRAGCARARWLAPCRGGAGEALEDLEAQELRLYVGWGDHLPVEVQERIELLHRRRLELEAQLDIM